MYVSNEDQDIPRLSAAIIIPSLYLIASTLVPVTMGCLHQIIIRDFQYIHVVGGESQDALCVLYALLKRIFWTIGGSVVKRIGVVPVISVIAL